MNNNKKKIDFSPPDITEAEIAEVVDTLKSGWITTGQKTKLFEKNIADYCNTSKAVCLNSATAGMELILRYLGVGQGDEVITSSYTYTASASVICHVGAKPVLIDVKKDSFEMDYEQLEKAITLKTKVIIPVDIGGILCDYDRIINIVESKSRLFRPSNDIQSAFDRNIVLADAAHSFGASQRSKKSGEIADFTSFSFHAVKNITTGEGGAITWKDITSLHSEDIYRSFMLLSLHGQSKDAFSKNNGNWEYDIVNPGYKCNMTDISASLGLSQLKRYDATLLRRKEIVQFYDSEFLSINASSPKHYGVDFSSSGHLYLLRLLGKDESFRNQLISKLSKQGIVTNVHYKPLPMFTAYKNIGFEIKDYPNAFNMYKNEITLPLHTLLTNDDVAYISDKLKKSIDEL
jgi:dTDP-4-amino-4,6-dideoxygalactose transaminase